MITIFIQYIFTFYRFLTYKYFKGDYYFNKFCKISQYIDKIRNRQMLQEQSSLQKDVERSLNRLQVFLNNNNLLEIIPSLYYCTDLLKKYANQIGPDNVNYVYFRQFKGELQSFATKDLSGMKQHQRQILNQMIQIFNSDLFTECLKPEIRSSHINFAKNKEHKVSSNAGSLPQSNNQNGNLNGNGKMPNNGIAQLGTKLQPSPQHTKNYEIFYDSLLVAYREHRIDEAYAIKNEYLHKKYPLTPQQKQLFDTIQLQYNTMISFHKQFDLEGWIFDKQENGVTLQYKIFQAEKQIAIRIGSQFEVPIQNFLSILTEIDLMQAYIPFTYDSKQMKIISRNEKIGTSKIYIPCLTDRQTYFYAAGYDRMKVNGSVFLFSKTINQDKIYQQKYGFKVPDKSDYVRLEYKFFIVEYIPITRTKARVRLASKIDMKLNYLPQFIINMSARKFAFDYFKNIIKMNKNFKGSPWEKRIQENPQFYGFFKRKVEEYMGKK